MAGYAVGCNAQPALRIHPAELPRAAVGKAYRPPDLRVTGGETCSANNPGLVLVAGALPEGLSLDLSGRFSGVPRKAGEFPFTLRASTRCLATEQRFRLVVTGAPVLKISSERLEFRYEAGGPVPAPQVVLVGADWPDLAYGIANVPAWLTVRACGGEDTAAGRRTSDGYGGSGSRSGETAARLTRGGTGFLGVADRQRPGRAGAVGDCCQACSEAAGRDGPCPGRPASASRGSGPQSANPRDAASGGGNRCACSKAPGSGGGSPLTNRNYLARVPGGPRTEGRGYPPYALEYRCARERGPPRRRFGQSRLRRSPNPSPRRYRRSHRSAHRRLRLR